MSCAAGGFHADGASHSTQAFVVNERNGNWGTAQEVAANLNIGAGSRAGVMSVSCASAGNCSAGGTSECDYNWGFVVSEKNGVWGTGMEMPGLGVLNKGGNAAASWCRAPGRAVAWPAATT